jgi:acyl-CoA thioesterase I
VGGEKLWSSGSPVSNRMIRTPRHLRAVLAVLALTACSRGNEAPRPAEDASAPLAAARPLILCVGTSLTAGLGLPDPDLAYPALLQEKVTAAGYPHEVRNAGVSGETSAGALSRLDWLLRQPVSVFILETGANDALRGQAPASTRANVDAILKQVTGLSPRPRVLLLGMEAPPNMGLVYAAQFRSLFPDLAEAHGVALVPFFLEGVAGIPALNQPDGLHPTPEGQKKMAETIWKGLEPLLK